jgi:hypothetical protein
VKQRLKSAVLDLPRVEAAYMEVMQGLDAPSRQYYMERILGLYAQVIGILPRAANLGLDHHDRLLAVTGTDKLACKAATWAICLQRDAQAVEMLEEGRAIFWSQTFRLRATGFDGVPESDSCELRRLLCLLDRGTPRVEGVDQTPVRREEEFEPRRILNEQAEMLI